MRNNRNNQSFGGGNYNRNRGNRGGNRGGRGGFRGRGRGRGGRNQRDVPSKDDLDKELDSYIESVS